MEKKIISLYDLNDKEIEELDAALYEANNMNSISIKEFSDENKNLMWSFARKLDTLDKETIKKFLDD